MSADERGMHTVFLICKPGMCPMVGYPNPADIEGSLREWMLHNQGAEILVLRSTERMPAPGTLWADTAKSYLAPMDSLEEVQL